MFYKQIASIVINQHVTIHDVGTQGCLSMLSSGCRSRGFPVLKCLFRWRRQLGRSESSGCRRSSASVSFKTQEEGETWRTYVGAELFISEEVQSKV